VIGFDTNIILRVFDRSDVKQSAAVDRLLEKPIDGETYLLNPIVLTEFVWTLDRTYKVRRAVIADHLERILQAPEFVVPFADAAEEATLRYREGPADFSDYFIAAINRTLGCRSTLTFDEAAAKDENFMLLKA
jgi:predicted nucleic-acid-binding protein